MEELLRRHKQERKLQRQAANERLQGTKGEERTLAEASNKAEQEELLTRHAMEKLALESPATDDVGAATNPVPSAAASPAAASAPVPAAPSASTASGTHMTKAQRRREKKKQQEAARAEEIALAKESRGPSDRELELDAINTKLRGDGLQVREVKADGNCMYRAIADQLLQTGNGSGLIQTGASADETAGMFRQLRALCAQHIETHRDAFAPFIEADGEVLDSYCAKVRDTNEWGGQVELQALAGALQVPIVVHSAAASDVVVGEEFMHSVDVPLRVTYHRHYYALGEHYNSVEAWAETPGGEGNGASMAHP